MGVGPLTFTTRVSWPFFLRDVLLTTITARNPCIQGLSKHPCPSMHVSKVSGKRNRTVALPALFVLNVSGRLLAIEKPLLPFGRMNTLSLALAGNPRAFNWTGCPTVASLGPASFG